MNYTVIWLIAFVVPLGFGVWAQVKVSRTFKRYSKVPTSTGITGADAARSVMGATGLEGLSIHQAKGHLTDHYNPGTRTLNLSADVGQAATVSAVGVASHEAGHAIQDAEGYWPMRVRQTLVPVANVGSTLWFFPLIIGFIFNASGLITIGLVLFSAIVLFQLVTLPVEFDASKRALAAIEKQHLLTPDEFGGARAVLRAAALTYVAALVASVAQLIYFALLSRR